MVIKTNVTLPFCVWHHIGICLDELVMSIKIDARIFFTTHGLLSLCMATKNGFGRHKIGN